MHTMTIIAAFEPLQMLAGTAGGLIVGAVVFWLAQNIMGKNRMQAAEQKSKSIVHDAEMQAENITKTVQLEAKAEAIKRREGFEKETTSIRNELRNSERHLSKREDTVDRKWDMLTSKERTIEKLEKKVSDKERDLDNKDKQLTNTLSEQRATLLRIASITPEEAKEILLARLEGEVSHEASALIEKIISKAKEEADSRSREITLNAIQRYAAEHTCDSTVSTVDIPSDEMKGRVIGREGRNIRAFEKASGVDVIIDDTPGVVVVSAFDPIRREVARISLDKLIKDGRIHPARIEEIVEESSKEIDKELIEIGKRVTLEANVNGINN